jgi:type VI secretion system secreted protein Hcp
MSDVDEQATGPIQRFRFRVVAPDGRELVSDVVQVQFPAAPKPAAVAARAEAPLSPAGAPAAFAPPPGDAPAAVLADTPPAVPAAAPAVAPVLEEVRAEKVSSDPFRVSAILVSVKGTVQGQFKAETGRKAYKEHFDALAVDYQVAVPVDAGSGHSAGRHQHHPFCVTKEWGAATPQLFQALVKNEVLQSVEIDCLDVDKGGAEAVVHKVKLTNATVASIQQLAGTAIRDADGRQHPPRETVAFAFEKLEHLTPKDGVLASDQQQR